MAPKKDAKAPEFNPWSWATHTPVADIGLPHLIKVYRLDNKICPYYCRRPCKKNPLCLWGLGDRHWRKEDETEEERERNPNREDGKIIGIQNLGQTCYVNSLLQLWYHNPIIKPAILMWKPTTSNTGKSCAVSELQAMFARLKSSRQSAIDPRPLVTALELDTSVQQDAQEFSKLLLACIMNTLAKSPGNEEIFTTFKRCFTGQSQFQTCCDKCKNISHASPEDFNELQLPVLKRLKESFEEYLKPSRLEGDNKYRCPHCDSYEDAERRMKILSLPPVLNLQLMRFVFDCEAQGRKKVQKSIEFPQKLDMTEFMDEEYRLDEDGKPIQFEYQLNAVLIHKGRKVSSGHYIAHIRDSVSGGWFECNDDSIEKIDKKGYSKNLVMHDEEEDVKEKNGAGDSEKTDRNPNSASTSKKKEPSTSADSKDSVTQSSTGAYMLVYTMVKYFEQPQPDPKISDELAQLIKEEDEIFEAEFSRTKAEKDREAKKKADRQAEVDMLFKHRIPVDGESENGENSKPKQNGSGPRQNDAKKNNSTSNSNTSSSVQNMEVNVEDFKEAIRNYDFIAAEWLEKCLDPKVADPPFITNENINCPHGKLSPPKRRDVTVMYKAIPKNFADHVFAKYGGNRLTGESALCLECVKTHCQMIISLQTLEKDQMTVLASSKKTDEILEHFRRSGSPPSHSFLNDKVIIGKETLRIWRKYARDEIERPDSEDCQEILKQWTFNQDVECTHGALNPNTLGSRKFIPLSSWSILNKYFPNAVTYHHTNEECPQCLNINEANAVVKDQNKMIAMKQKQHLAQLLVGKNRPDEFQPGEYHIVPTLFVEEWRRFIKDPDGNNSIDSIKMDDLFCDCTWCGCPQPSFKYPIDAIQKARAMDAENWDVITLIRTEELKFFIECGTTYEWDLKLNIEQSDSILSYSYNYSVCRPSSTRWLTNLTNKAFEYVEGNIYIKKIESEEELGVWRYNDDEEEIPPTKKLKDEIPSSNNHVRRSNRTRHSRNEYKYKSIQSTMRVKDFQKNMLIKDYNAMMSDQHLYYNNKELTEEQKRMTFGELKIPSGATLHLKVDVEKSIDMDTDKPTRPEQGFSGTLLASTHTFSPVSHSNGLSV